MQHRGRPRRERRCRGALPADLRRRLDLPPRRRDDRHHRGAGTGGPHRAGDPQRRRPLGADPGRVRCGHGEQRRRPGRRRRRGRGLRREHGAATLEARRRAHVRQPLRHGRGAGASGRRHRRPDRCGRRRRRHERGRAVVVRRVGPRHVRRLRRDAPPRDRRRRGRLRRRRSAHRRRAVDERQTPRLERGRRDVRRAVDLHQRRHVDQRVRRRQRTPRLERADRRRGGDRAVRSGRPGAVAGRHQHHRRRPRRRVAAVDVADQRRWDGRCTPGPTCDATTPGRCS